jgi:hypothetical protein
MSMLDALLLVNVLHIGGREIASPDLTTFGRAPFIRNCLVDGGSPTSATAEYRALSMGACHGGVVEGNQIHNVKIGGPYQDKLSTREIIVRNNTYRNVIKGPYWNLGVSSAIGVEKLLVEGNHIELIADTVSPVPVGIHLEDGAATPEPHGDVILRHNRIRYVDGATGSFNGYGLQVNGAKGLILSHNQIETLPSGVNPIQTLRCPAVGWFDNRTPTGALIPREDPATGKPVEELDAAAEDVLVAACYRPF